VLTGDVDFGNELVCPPTDHRGVVLTRLSERSASSGATNKDG
jgi:hypothetical protein